MPEKKLTQEQKDKLTLVAAIERKNRELGERVKATGSHHLKPVLQAVRFAVSNPLNAHSKPNATVAVDSESAVSSETPSTRKKVFVAGAGGSGLATAYMLENMKEFKVTLADSRDHLGGHIDTIYFYKRKDLKTGQLLINPETGNTIWSRNINQMQIDLNQGILVEENPASAEKPCYVEVKVGQKKQKVCIYGLAEGGAEFIGSKDAYPNTHKLFESLNVVLKPYELNAMLHWLSTGEALKLPPAFDNELKPNSSRFLGCCSELPSAKDLEHLMMIQYAIVHARKTVTPHDPEHFLTLEEFVEHLNIPEIKTIFDIDAFAKRVLYPLLEAAWGDSDSTIFAFKDFTHENISALVTLFAQKEIPAELQRICEDLQPSDYKYLEISASEFTALRNFLAQNNRTDLGAKLKDTLEKEIKGYGAHYVMNYLQLGKQWNDASNGLSTYPDEIDDRSKNLDKRLNTTVKEYVPVVAAGQPTRYKVMLSDGSFLKERNEETGALTDQDEVFDEIVGATPPSTASTMLPQNFPSDREFEKDLRDYKKLLSKVRYYDTEVIFHTDQNYRAKKQNPIVHTRIENVPGLAQEIAANTACKEKLGKGPICKTWWHKGQPRPNNILAVRQYRHPRLDKKYFKAELKLKEMNAKYADKHGLRFGGILFRGDSHEDAVTSGLMNAEAICRKYQCLQNNARLAPFLHVVEGSVVHENHQAVLGTVSQENNQLSTVTQTEAAGLNCC